MKTTEKTFFGHPMGLSTLFFTEMWERFSFYGMRAILILFMTTEQAQHGLGLSTADAGAAYGLYTASVYLLSLPGGWIADNLIGQKKAIWYGGILIMLGHVLLAVPGSTSIFFAGLAFVSVGTGFLKPNISSIVGNLYENDSDARRDAGFSIFYMSINIGALLGQILVPVLAAYNWHYGFGLAAVGMFFGLLYYRMTEQKYLLGIGEQPEKSQTLMADATDEPIMSTNNTWVKYLLPIGLLACLVLFQVSGIVNLTTIVGLADAMKYIIIMVAVFFFLYVLSAGGLTSEERKRTFVIILLFIGAATFWSGFEQAGSALNLFARDFTDRDLFGFEIPAGALQSVNSFFIIVFAPIIGALWVKLAARQLNPRTPIKFALGLLLLGVGFLVMVAAAKIATTGAKAGMMFLVMAYFFHSIGELCLSPVGLSTITKLAPKKYSSQMMGIWFVATAFGNLIAGIFGGHFDPDNLSEMPNLFMTFVMLPCSVALIFVILYPIMKKWMGKVE